MIAACKCENCGHIEMSSEDDVTLEIDFLDKRILYICRQCKHKNTIDFGGVEDKGGATPLPRIRFTS